MILTHKKIVFIKCTVKELEKFNRLLGSNYQEGDFVYEDFDLSDFDLEIDDLEMDDENIKLSDAFYIELIND